MDIDSILEFKGKGDEYYEILGCSEHSTTEQILTEYKARVLDCHPDKNPHDPEAVNKFAKLSQAKDVLCDPEKRHSYDIWRNSGLSVSFEQWASLRQATRTSMHWATTQPQPTIQSREHLADNTPHQPSATDVIDTSRKLHSTPMGSTSSQNTITNAALYDSTYHQRVQWERDPPSDMLRKFRNYEI